MRKNHKASRGIHTMPFKQSGWMKGVLGLSAVLWLHHVPGAAELPEAQLIQPAESLSQLKKVHFQQDDGGYVVRLEFDRPAANCCRVFSTLDPTQLVLTLNNATYAAGDLNALNTLSDLKNIEIYEAKQTTRLVFKFKKNVTVDYKTDGNDVLIQWGRTPAATPASKQPVQSEPLVERDAVTSIDFRRGKDGQGRVLIDLSGENMSPDVRMENGQLLLELKGSGIADSLLKILDVSDFGTPVQRITTRRTPRGVSLNIQTNGYWEHSVVQENNRLLLEIKPLSTDPISNNLLGRGNAFKGDKISLNFQSIEIRNLLQVFAEFTQMNVVAADNVTGQVSVRLKNVPWDQALDIILKSRGLGVRQSGNVLLIAPIEELTRREQTELQAKNQLIDLEPLKLEIFTLNYQKADDVVTLLSNDKQRILSRRGSAVRDVRTNQVFVQDTQAQLEQVRQVINRLDIPVRQVMIEARVVIAESSFASALGAKLGFVDLRGVNGGSGTGSKIPGTGVYSTIGGTQTAVTTTTGQTGSAGFPAINTTNMVNLPAQLNSGNASSSVALSLFNSTLTQFINLELTALEEEGSGKVISSPRIVTSDQVKALIEQGTEIPYTTSSALGTSSVSFKKANLKLEVTPQITPEGGVILDVDITKDAKGDVVVGGVSINTKHVQTKVLVDNGGTVVIGGIFESEDKDSQAKTPFFGDIPVLGNLFKKSIKESKKTELMVFLTPRVLSNTTGR